MTSPGDTAADTAPAASTPAPRRPRRTVPDTTPLVLLGAYPAKQCTYRAHAEAHPDLTRPEPVADVLADRRRNDGIAFENWVTTVLKAVHGDQCVLIEPAGSPAERITATKRAIDDHALVICGGRLPDLPHTGRSGSPDILVSHPDRPGTYLPVDIKHHHTFKTGRGATTQVNVSTLRDPANIAAVPYTTDRVSHRRDDGLQLAHYTRMLEELGVHPGPDQQLGAIIGTSKYVDLVGDPTADPYCLTWYDLAANDTEHWEVGAPKKVKKSLLAIYDQRFALRLDVARNAARRRAPIVPPRGKDECYAHGGCPWLTHCTDTVPADDASFAFTTGRPNESEWAWLYGNGGDTILGLASLDADSHRAAFDPFIPPSTSHRNQRLERHVRRARLIRDGIVLERHEAGVDGLGTVTGPVDLVTADVEIDFDVEWHPADDHVYQWGVRVRRWQDDSTATYKNTVVSFDELDDNSAGALADQFFVWLHAFVDREESLGNTVAIYHWHHPELTRSERVYDRLDELFGDRTVDLKKSVEAAFFARDGYSLKKIAPAFGFHWSVDDAGGARSILEVEAARQRTNKRRAEEAQKWLLSYNESDCAAQAAIRDGIKSLGRGPRIIG